MCVCCSLRLRVRVHTLRVSVYALMDDRKVGQLSRFASQRTHLQSAFALLKNTRLLDVGTDGGYPMPYSGPPGLAYSTHFTTASSGCAGHRKRGQ